MFRSTRTRPRPIPASRGSAIAWIGLFLLVATPVRAETVSIEAARDNTLFEDPTGALSNGEGDYLFAGRTAQGGGVERRRALLAFDVASHVPAGSVITGVTLRLFVSRQISGERTVSIHRSGEAPVPCEVRYQKGEGPSVVLWEAHNEVGYCEARAAEFAAAAFIDHVKPLEDAFVVFFGDAAALVADGDAHRGPRSRPPGALVGTAARDG